MSASSSSSSSTTANAKSTEIKAENFDPESITVLPGRDFVSFKDGSMFKFTTSPLLMAWPAITGEGNIGKIMKFKGGDEQPVTRTGCKFTYGLAYAGADEYAAKKVPGLAAMNDADFKALHELFQQIMGHAFDTSASVTLHFRNLAITKAISSLALVHGFDTDESATVAYYANTKPAFNAAVLKRARTNFIDGATKRMPNPSEYAGGFKTVVKKSDGTPTQMPLRFFTEKKVWVRKDGYKEKKHDEMPKTLTHMENNGIGPNWFAVYDDMSRYYTYQPIPFYSAATENRYPHRMIKHGSKFYPDPTFDPTNGNDAFVSVTLSFKLIGAKTNYGIEPMASYVNIIFDKPRAPTYVNPWKSFAEAPTEQVSSATIEDDYDEDAPIEGAAAKKQKTGVEDELAAAQEAFAASAEDVSAE